MFKKLIKRIKRWYWSWKSPIMADAVYYFKTRVEDGKYRCPECDFRTTNSIKFEEHISEVHGYPKDIDIMKYYEEPEYKPLVEPANPLYIEMLKRSASGTFNFK